MELTAGEAWARILDRAREQLPEQTYRTWFARTRPVALSQDLLVIEAGSEFATEWIEDKYGRLLGDISADVFGRRFTISFQHHAESRPQRPGPQPSAESGSALTGESASPADAPRATPGPIVGSPLNERYVFERFVVGSNNQLAAAACRAVAEAPAKMYNPLFIYGGVGLGKTHLMHAIGNAVAAKFPRKRILYATSEKFTNDFINSIREQKMEDFRGRYRRIDVLLIDDIQFIADRERTQEEFFHTFNAIHEAGKQVVLSSDRPPKAITTLEERLRSRFEWGLIADIAPPDFETRLAILQKKAERDKQMVPQEVLAYIAEAHPFAWVFDDSDTAVQVAPTDITVLILGESGSGKEVFPQIIHQLSSRKHGPYIAVNCGAIPEGTIDSELFGHEKGAFTGAAGRSLGVFRAADGGVGRQVAAHVDLGRLGRLDGLAERQLDAADRLLGVAADVLRSFGNAAGGKHVAIVGVEGEDDAFLSGGRGLLPGELG